MTALAPTLGHTTRPPTFDAGHPLGVTGAFGADPIAMLLSAHRQCGPVARGRLGPMEAWFAFDPEDVDRVLRADAHSYSKATRGYDKLRLILGEGLVTSEGETWKRRRRIANPAFRKQRIEGFLGTMNASTVQLAEGWEGERDVAHDMMALTLDIACRTFFSTEVESETEAIGKAMEGALSQFNHLVSTPLPFVEYWPTPGNARFWAGIRTLDRVVGDIVRERRASDAEHHDLLEMLLEAADAEENPMTDRELRDELVTMLSAGHETTANALTWTLYCLSLHPVWARRVEEELDAVLGGRPMTMADMGRLQVLRRVLDESMRLYPPVWMLGRMVEEETTLGGYAVPKGTLVFLSPYATHRSPQYWENPEGFDPDRFLPERSEGRPKQAYFPFSAGSRKCIGDRFAIMEAMSVLAVLLQKYRVEAIPGEAPVLDPSVTLRPKHGLRMRVVPR
ncbi:MAG: cytochrome P450 [Deltaproteobacteria bacterium]|nr:MAG: cytochrome P450 [Deltaproteobacteria bacterium]